MNFSSSDNRVQGIGVAPGVAWGPLVLLPGKIHSVPRRALSQGALDGEVTRFRGALEEAEREFRQQTIEFGGDLDEAERRIFDTHLHLYQDDVFREAIEKRIQDGKINAEAAILDEIQHLTGVLQGMDSLFRERQADIRDVGQRINRILLNQAQASLIGGTEPFILYARELLPSDTLTVDRTRLLGIVTELGGAASHVAILARAFDIPAVSGIRDLESRVRPGFTIAVDGTHGQVWLEPTAEQTDELEQARSRHLQERERWNVRASARARAEDEAGIRVLLNIENFEALRPEVLASIDGIGLYRTEFLFMGRDLFPSEEEQFEFYRGVVERIGDREVTFRIIDVGGDKPLSYLSIPKELNPSLGWRGIRLTFEWPDLLIPQLRALLRASRFGKVKIMLPMITTVEELRQAKELLSQLRDDLIKQGEDIPGLPPLGVMIEVPAAAMASEDLAAEADFLSIGTNDLGQYFFAVDRNNLQVARLYQPLHPAMLRLLKNVIDAADRQNTEVSVCGEMAGEAFPVLALMGLGLRRFSMSPSHVPEARWIMEMFQPDEAAALVNHLLDLKTEAEVRSLLQQAVQERSEASQS